MPPYASPLGRRANLYYSPSVGIKNMAEMNDFNGQVSLCVVGSGKKESVLSCQCERCLLTVKTARGFSYDRPDQHLAVNSFQMPT